MTTYTRTAGGLPTQIDAPEGATTQLEYNDYGQVTRATNPNGHVTEYTYFAQGDSKGYLEKEMADPGGLALTTRYEVDKRGNVTAATDPRGTRHTSAYNELDWLVADTAAAGPLGYTTTYVYDGDGQATEVREPYDLGGGTASTDTTYGPLGEVLSVARHIEPAGTVATTLYEYDKNRNPTKVTDPDQHVTATVYDERNQPMSRTMGQGSAAEVTESYAYDTAGRLITRTDGRATTGRARTTATGASRHPSIPWATGPSRATTTAATSPRLGGWAPAAALCSPRAERPTTCWVARRPGRGSS